MGDPRRSSERTTHAKRLVGGPEATSWAVLGLTAGLLLIDRLGTDLGSTRQPLLLVSSALVGSLAIVGVLRLSRLTLVRDATAKPRPFLTLLWFAVAASTAAFTGRTHDEMVGLPFDRSSTYIFERTGWGFTVLLLMAICRTVVTAHRAELASQMTRAATLQRIRIEVDGLLSTAVASELAAVTAEVHTELARLDDVDAHGAISLLRHVGLQVVRSRSHELAAPAPRYQPSDSPEVPSPVRLRELVADITTDRPIRPALPAAMVALWGTAFTFFDAGPLGALIVGSVLGTIALGTWGSIGFVVDRALIGRGTPMRIIIVLIAIPAAASAWIAAAEALEHLSGLALPTAETTVQRAAQAMTLTLFPIVQVLSRALRRRGELSTEQLRAYNDALESEIARANTELWAQRRALSVELHGWIQATVNAATLRVSKAVREGYPHEAILIQARSEIERALASLTGRITHHGRSGPGELDRAIERICGLWEGLVDIEVDLPESPDDALEHDATMQAALVEALTEACSNAVRHGDAGRIRARITATERVVLLDVVDDGRAIGHGSPGQGSALLDEIALEWRRTKDDTGAQLAATFARL
jgi:two-component system, NarL family, sensor histidine kinase UhpB